MKRQLRRRSQLRKDLTLTSKRIGKKGNAIIDTVFFMAVLFGLVTIVIIMKEPLSEIRAEFETQGTFSNQSIGVIQKADNDYNALFDNIILAVFILLWALVLVASFLIDAHPLFYFFSFILLIFVFYIAAEMSNWYNEIATDTALAEHAVNLGFSNFIFNNLLIVTIIVGFSIMLVLFTKNRFVLQ